MKIHHLERSIFGYTYIIQKNRLNQAKSKTQVVVILIVLAH